MKIQITASHAELKRIGGTDYADKHLRKIYDAEVGDDGWAIIDGAKFDPITFRATYRHAVISEGGE